MKKIMNKAENFVDDMIEGILAAHPGELTTVAGDLRCMVNKNKTALYIKEKTGNSKCLQR